MDDDEALDKWIKKRYPIRHGFNNADWKAIKECEQESTEFKLACAVQELKESIKDALPKWLKWVI